MEFDLQELSTYNLTPPTPRNPSSFHHNAEIDITGPNFRLPFDFGWKREIVYKIPEECAYYCRYTNGYVRYYAPNNKKLRSLHEIQEYLNLSFNEENPLTLENFSFLLKPIGICDRSKELIRSIVCEKLREKKKLRYQKTLTLKTEQPSCDIKLFDDAENYFNARKYSKCSSKVIPLPNDFLMNGFKTTTTFEKRRDNTIQSINDMIFSIRHIFKFLEVHELLIASRVCVGWNIIAMNTALWQTVRLQNSSVKDWNKCIATLKYYRTVTLDTRSMLIPTKIDELDTFWLQFTNEIKKAQQLKSIKLYKCPTSVVEDIFNSLPQLEVLNATSINIPIISENECIPLNLYHLYKLEHLTELRIKGLTGIQVTHLPSFVKLVNLKFLSITSIKEFPDDVHYSLATISKNLESLEIGDCNGLPNHFFYILRKFTKLTSLRLENWDERFENYAKEVFYEIRSLDNLRILELINIEFSHIVVDELKKCNGIKALLIIPTYDNQVALTNFHLIDCLKKLSNTLTHLVWGLTDRIIKVTNLFIKVYHDENNISYNPELQYIPKLKIRKPKWGSGEEERITYKKKNFLVDDMDIISVPALEELLKTMMIHAKTKVVIVPIESTTQVYLLDHFNVLD